MLSETKEGRLNKIMVVKPDRLTRSVINLYRTEDGPARVRYQGGSWQTERRLTDHHREKNLRILEEEPDISNYRPEHQFEGISRNTTIKLAKRGRGCCDQMIWTI